MENILKREKVDRIMDLLKIPFLKGFKKMMKITIF